MEQFFLQLLDMSIRAGMVIGIILVVRAFLNLVKIPKYLVYLLWLIPFIRLICPWSPQSPVGLIPETVEWIVMESSQGEMMQTIPEGIQFETYSKQADRLGVKESLEQKLQQDLETERRMQEPEENIESVEKDTELQGALQHNSQRGTFLSWGWLIGVILLLLYSICSYIRLRKKLAASMPVGSRIYLSDSIDTPFVMGMIKPVIYLPSGIGEQEMHYVIAHEQVHIMRRDYLIKIAAFLTVCVHWFNPLAWAALFFMGKDMEMSCDEAVIRKLGEACRREYASVLLDLTSGQQKICGMPLAFDGGNIKGRIKNIMKYKKPVLAVSVLSVLGIAALSVVLLTIPEKDAGEKMTDSGADNRKTVSADSETRVSEGEYRMKVPLGAEPLFVPGLTIGKNNSFTFSYDLASSYMPYGTYEINGDVLTASTSDGLYQYQFKVKEDGTLIFLEEGSSEVKLFDDNLGIAVLDGSEFVRQTKREADVTMSSYPGDFDIEDNGAFIYEAMEVTEITVTPATVTEKTGFGADGVELDYVDDENVILHGYFGLFVYSKTEKRVIRSVDLAAIGCEATQGDAYCDVQVKADGTQVYLHSVNESFMYVYEIDENKLYKQEYNMDGIETFSSFRDVRELAVEYRREGLEVPDNWENGWFRSMAADWVVDGKRKYGYLEIDPDNFNSMLDLYYVENDRREKIFGE